MMYRNLSFEPSGKRPSGFPGEVPFLRGQACRIRIESEGVWHVLWPLLHDVDTKILDRFLDDLGAQPSELLDRQVLQEQLDRLVDEAREHGAHGPPPGRESLRLLEEAAAATLEDGWVDLQSSTGPARAFQKGVRGRLLYAGVSGLVLHEGPVSS